MATVVGNRVSELAAIRTTVAGSEARGSREEKASFELAARTDV
jgi:hypothetical protein